MAIVPELGKGQNVLEISGTAAVDLSSSQYMFVVLTLSVSSGRFTVSLPSGQGVTHMGILQNAPAAGEQADVRVIGTTKVVANAAFDIGPITPAASTGKAGAATSGDFVTAQALQAASAANHKVWCMVNGCNPAQIN